MEKSPCQIRYRLKVIWEEDCTAAHALNLGESLSASSNARKTNAILRQTMMNWGIANTTNIDIQMNNSTQLMNIEFESLRLNEKGLSQEEKLIQIRIKRAAQVVEANKHSTPKRNSNKD